MSSIKDFVQALTTNPKAVELLKEAGEPANIEEAAVLYADVAEKAGISVSKETICALLEQKEKIQQELTAKAESAVKEALDENALESVAGGIEGEKMDKCASTAIPGEWCWFSDACSLVINYYDYPNLKYDEEAYNKAKEKYGGVEDFDSFEVWTKEDEALPDCEMLYETHF